MRIAEAAELVLKDASEPMHPREIAARIAANNHFVFKTADPTGVVSKALRKSETFERVGDGRFRLRS